MVFKNLLLLILISLFTSSCSLWPYQRDFDCPIKEGVRCKSLYEISLMADEGVFSPNYKKSLEEKSKQSKQKRYETRCRAKGCCHAS